MEAMKREKRIFQGLRWLWFVLEMKLTSKLKQPWVVVNSTRGKIYLLGKFKACTSYKDIEYLFDICVNKPQLAS